MPTSSELNAEQLALLGAALDLYGALTGPDWQELGISQEAALASGLVTLLPTVIGPLAFPLHTSTVTGNAAGSWKVPRKSASNSTDCAYMRLFIAQQPQEIQVPNPAKLGRLLKDQTQMPSVYIDDGRRIRLYLMAGKVLGGGLSVRRVNRYLTVMKPTMLNEERRLIVVTPHATRLNGSHTAFSPLLEVVEYSAEEAMSHNRME